MLRINTTFLLSLLFVMSCGRKEVAVSVSNNTQTDIGSRIIEVPAGRIFAVLQSKGFYVENSKNQKIPYQLTHDSLILFKAEVKPGESEIFKIVSSDSIHSYPAVAWGNLYPKRRDDVAYENDKVGFRIYGPGTQNAGEKAYGYDIFFKYPTEELIVPQLYAAETDDKTWAKVDSLRRISNELAEEFIESFSYHIDHGKGMDCYAVGATLGAGVAALVSGDSIVYPWCYEKFEILDNGPLRFTLSLDFPVSEIGGEKITEHRIISLDEGNHLNNTKVWYENQFSPMQFVTGFPLRDESEPFTEITQGILSYSDPTQGEFNGRALLGIVMNHPVDSIMRKENHILLSGMINPKDTLCYNWGFAWDKTDIKTLSDWNKYLKTSKLNYTISIN